MHAKLFIALLALQGVFGNGSGEVDYSSSTMVTTTSSEGTTSTTVPGANPSTTTTTQTPQQTTTPDPNANKLNIRILRVENPAGTLADGKTACSEFSFAGEQCSMSLKFGVSLGDSDCVVVGDSNSLQYGNVVDIQPPKQFTTDQANGVFAGFNLCAQLVDPNGQIIADFKDSTDDSIVRGIKTLYTDSGASIKFAWNSHAAPAPPPTTTPVVTTGGSTTVGTTTEPGTTTAPIIASDCDDYPDRKDGVKTIYIADQRVKVYCQYGAFSGALTTIQSRGELDNVVFSNKTDDYALRFGNAGKGNNFWLGLENMHTLTNTRGYNLQIDVCCGETIFSQQIYENIVIGNKADGYILNATADTANIGLDLLSSATVDRKDLGMRFMTSEDYNTYFDDEMQFCEILQPKDDGPVEGTGGWWFGSCANNLNGGYIKTDPAKNCTIAGTDYPDGTGIQFRYNPGFSSGDSYLNRISFTRVRMALYRSNIKLVQGIPPDDFCKGK